jgi:hypothetical protein
VKWLLAFALLIFALPTSWEANARNISTYGPQGVKVFRHHFTTAWACGEASVNAFVYEAGLAVDADGAYRAYHPKDRLALDSIEHAGHPGDWWALATDTGRKNGHPVLQQKGDPAPGYYVSMTSLFDARIPNEHDPRRFVDAVSIPYVVLPPVGFKHARLGDFAMVINLRNGRAAGAIVADESAPDLKMGEGSIALANALGIDSDARTGGTERGVAYVIYPGSGNGNPRTAGEIARTARREFERWGGLEKLKRCLPKGTS